MLSKFVDGLYRLMLLYKALRMLFCQRYVASLACLFNKVATVKFTGM